MAEGLELEQIAKPAAAQPSAGLLLVLRLMQS
jgi:hypothetical protein